MEPIRVLSRETAVDAPGDDSSALGCLVYIQTKPKPEQLAQEFIDEYSSSGPHGRPYVKWEDQEPSEAHFP